MGEFDIQETISKFSIAENYPSNDENNCVSLFNFSFLGFPIFLTLPFQKGKVRKTVTTFLSLPFQKGRVRKTVTKVSGKKS